MGAVINYSSVKSDRSDAPPTRVTIISRIPTPYRAPVYKALSIDPRFDLTVLYCARVEPNRSWVLPEDSFKHVWLRERFLRLGDNRFVHLNTDVWRQLRLSQPEIVVTNGYNFTDLIAILYCVLKRAKHVSHTDGTLESEATLSWAHRVLRKAVRWVTAAYIGPSDSSLSLFRSFGMPSNGVFKSVLAVDNDRFNIESVDDRDYDILFAGRLTPTKNPLFAIELAALTSRQLGRPVSLLVVGDGPLIDEAQDLASRHGVVAHFEGFVQQDELPRWYARAKVFVFPTTWDPWGLVLNEACAAGLPVLVSEYAGSGRELVVEGLNGHRLPLELEVWSNFLSEILQDQTVRASMSKASVAAVRGYTFAESTAGYSAALAHVAFRG